MDRAYCFAGISCAVQLPADSCYTEFAALEAFRAEKTEAQYRYIFRTVPALTPPDSDCRIATPGLRVYERDLQYIGPVEKGWERANIRGDWQGTTRYLQMDAKVFGDGISGRTVLNCLELEHILAQNGCFLLHCAFVNLHGRGLLFTAPSGVGKSTQAALWQSARGAEIVNGDRAAVRVDASGAWACGIPFSGSSGICNNKSLPLAGIVYLKQAKTSCLRRLTGAEAFCRIWEGCSLRGWDREDVALVSQTVQQLLQNVPVWELACTPDESAVLALEGGLRE